MIATLVLLSSIRHGCIVVDGDRILVRHLAARIRGLSELPAETVFGLAPRVGVRRTIPGFEIVAFARKHGTALVHAPETCAVRPTTTLDARRIEESLIISAKALTGGTNVQLELLDFSRYTVAPGEIHFSATGLGRTNADMVTLWRGNVRDSGGRRFPIWARVRIWRESEVIITREAISANQPIRAEQLSMEKRRLPIGGETILADIKEATGMVAVRVLAQGEVLTSRKLARAREIKQGETVAVEVDSGAARLTLQAKAETGGRRGDQITLKNPSSGKRFQAVVAGPGRVTVSGGTNVAEN